jgi:hypothetical protein
VRLVLDEKLPPVAVQVTPALSLVVAVTGRPWVTVRPARFGETETAMPEALVIVSVTFIDFVCAELLESATWKVRGVLATTVVGVPTIAPLAAVSDKPAGKVPLVSDQR